MDDDSHQPLVFKSRRLTAHFIDPAGTPMERSIEVRTHPISGRSCRITYSRIHEKEAGAETLPPPPPSAADTENCPFCAGQRERSTPRLKSIFSDTGRLVRGSSVLFPNLFPYGAYSAVSLVSEHHFVEIGRADTLSYTDCLINCADYLARVLQHDPAAVYQAITQNHLPSAGGSLVHPHLQVHADGLPSNHHRFLLQRTSDHYRRHGRLLFSDYAHMEREDGSRMIGSSGPWQWMAAFAPEGFCEIWGIYPGVTSLQAMDAADWRHLACGIIRVQRFYRSLYRNGYNLGLLVSADPRNRLELRVIMVVRANYAAWVRSDHTGYEVMLGDMATFSAPEETARLARPFWQGSTARSGMDFTERSAL
jgi:UDPglucose--hexose-1-phosphate uridylyltransferase